MVYSDIWCSYQDLWCTAMYGVVIGSYGQNSSLTWVNGCFEQYLRNDIGSLRNTQVIAHDAPRAYDFKDKMLTAPILNRRKNMIAKEESPEKYLNN